MAMRQSKPLIVVVLALFFVLAIAQEDWIREGALSTPDVSVSGMAVTISVQSAAGGYWIGCSIKDEKGNWYDLEAQRASFTDPYHTFTWTAPAGGHYDGTVALWKKKVEDCGCYYCRKNGYHLEEELLRHNFTFDVQYPAGSYRVSNQGLTVYVQVVLPYGSGCAYVIFSDERSFREKAKPERFPFSDNMANSVASFTWTAPRSGTYYGKVIFSFDDDSSAELDFSVNLSD